MPQPDNPSKNPSVQLLSELIELDIMTARDYHAVAKVKGERHRQISALAAEHDRHVTELGAEVIALGGTPPRRTEARHGAATESPATATDPLEKVLHREAQLGDAYEKAAESELPPGPASLVRRHLEEEKRHRHLLKDLIADQYDNEHGPPTMGRRHAG